MEKKHLTHIDARGNAVMVDVSAKGITARRAIARALVVMNPAVLRRVMKGGIPKGDVIAAARIAGIQAAKRTHELIPLCHPIGITKIRLDFQADEARGTLTILAETRALDRTGVEMEALTAAAVAALTVYDMCKAVQRGIEIRNVCLLEKSGGKSGAYRKKEIRKSK